MRDVQQSSTLRKRSEEAFPVLGQAELDRLAKFGTSLSFKAGDALFLAGGANPGMFIILRGSVDVTRKDHGQQRHFIVNQGPGEFLAELGQLSGAPSYVDGHAVDDVDALLLTPDNLKRALIAEAKLGERILRALVLRRMSLIELGAGVLILGTLDNSDTAALVGFLTRNGQPHQVLSPVEDEASSILSSFSETSELPLVFCSDGTILRRPNLQELASAIGMAAPRSFQGRNYDVAIVGAGPAGLAAAVYAASEGLSVIVLDAHAFGGQAGASTRIENYFGFPNGISGQALAGRAYTQALKFGVDMAIPATVLQLDCTKSSQGELRIEVDRSPPIVARSVVIASGARYRRPEISELSRFEGRGVWYWASPLEATMVAGQDIFLVGGGNSAGQAAVFLAGYARSVSILVRRPLEATMSAYLIERIGGLDNVEVRVGASITALDGRERLEEVFWEQEGSAYSATIRHLFLFVGADPATEWLAGCGVVLQDGYVVTRSDLPDAISALRPSWSARPRPTETSVAGVFAIGDVRAGSVKRVGSAIGEGAQVVPQLHAHLASRSSSHQVRRSRSSLE